MPESALIPRIFSIFFYALISVMVVVINKILLTNYRFPSFQAVALGQIISTIIIVWLGKKLAIITFPDYDYSIPKKIFIPFPLPLLYGLNIVSGLGGTQMVNLPMFVALRRFSILMTLILEYFVLGIVASKAVCFSVGLMILGSIVAALYDLSFEAMGYFLVTINNICSSTLGVYTIKKLLAKDLGKYGLMYYNCLFILPTILAIFLYSGELSLVSNYFQSGKMTFEVWACFILSCICGFILNYAMLFCAQCNSALTTQCVGPIKNLLVTYIGMFSSGDFVFQWLNFIGINISVLGSAIYTYVTFCPKPSLSASPLPTKNEKELILI